MIHVFPMLFILDPIPKQTTYVIVQSMWLFFWSLLSLLPTWLFALLLSALLKIIDSKYVYRTFVRMDTQEFRFSQRHSQNHLSVFILI